MLMENETVEAFRMSGNSHDCGDKLGYLKAIVEYAMRDEHLGSDFTEFLQNTVNPSEKAKLKVV